MEGSLLSPHGTQLGMRSLVCSKAQDLRKPKKHSFPIGEVPKTLGVQMMQRKNNCNLHHYGQKICQNDARSKQNCPFFSKESGFYSKQTAFFLQAVLILQHTKLPFFGRTIVLYNKSHFDITQGFSGAGFNFTSSTSNKRGCFLLLLNLLSAALEVGRGNNRGEIQPSSGRTKIRRFPPACMPCIPSSTALGTCYVHKFIYFLKHKLIYYIELVVYFSLVPWLKLYKLAM